MGTYRRIKVASGRALERLAHYSRALRVGVEPDAQDVLDRVSTGPPFRRLRVIA